jgi:xanthine dehydrogenase accessory factor
MDDLGVFTELASALEAGRPAALVTVISTRGSAPGKVGYQMVVFAEGQKTLGTVGGGLIEARMIHTARDLLSTATSRIDRFDLSEGPDDEKGICGGSVDLLVETFDPAAGPLFRRIAAAVRLRPCLLVSVLSPGERPWKVLLATEEGTEGDPAESLPPAVFAAVRQAAERGESRLSVAGMDVFIQPLTPCPPVVVFGAGHVAGFISAYARSVGFRVIVVDDRPEYANPERFPDADTLLVEDFRRSADVVRIDKGTYVVIVTRGHVWDRAVLEQVVCTDACYIGMIGSRRKTRLILERLRTKGISDRLLQKVYAPIGLAIGAVTAEEIALAIVGEMVKIRRLGRSPVVGHMTLSPPTALPGVAP